MEPSGSKLWRLKYRFNGTERRLAFGICPDVITAFLEGRRKMMQAWADYLDELRSQKKAAKSYARLDSCYSKTQRVANDRHGAQAHGGRGDDGTQ